MDDFAAPPEFAVAVPAGTDPGDRLECAVVDPWADAAWDREIALHPQATFFHSARWARVLSKTYGHQPLYLRFFRSQELVALLPLMEVRSPITGRRGVSLPFTDTCAPLFFGTAARTPIYQRLTELGRERKWKSWEIRGGAAPSEQALPSVQFRQHKLDLRTGEEQLFRGMESSARGAVRKAQRSGLSIQISHTRDSVAEFYALHGKTRRRHGVPSQPWRFFENIHQEVIAPGSGFVVTARAGERAVAAAMFFELGNNAIYKFSASDESLQELRPNNLVMWHGIKALAASGIHELDFGRTSMHNEGLRRFKLVWGAEESISHYYKFAPAGGIWLTDRDRTKGTHIAIFKKLPVIVNRLAGAVLYPHLD